MPLVGEREFFSLSFLFFIFLFLNEKCKQEIQTNIPMMSLQSKPKQDVHKNSNEQTDRKSVV